MSQHAEHARQISGFIWQTMAGRGLNVARPALTQALQDLDARQLKAVHDAALQMAKGGDSHDLFHQLGALRIAASEPLRAELRGRGIYWRADKLLEVAATPELWKRFEGLRQSLALALRNDQAGEADTAAEGLRELLGTLSDPPAPAASPPDTIAVPPQETGAGHPAMAKTEPMPSRGTGGPQTRVLRQHKIYAQKAALTAEVALRGTTHVVMLDAASANGKGAGGQTGYNWADKLVFMCRPDEMVILLAVLMGWRGRHEFRFHGSARDKTLMVERQTEHHYIEMRATGVKLGVPVGPVDAYALAMLVLAGLAANEPDLGPQEILAVAKATQSASAAEGENA